MGGQRQAKLGYHRDHQHHNDNDRHLAEQAEARRDQPLRHLAARQQHIFSDRPAVAVSHRHTLDHKQTAKGGEHIGDAQHDDQEGVKQADKRTECQGHEDRFGSAKAVPDKERDHQRVRQRRRRPHGEIEPADGQ